MMVLSTKLAKIDCIVQGLKSTKHYTRIVQ